MLLNECNVSLERSTSCNSRWTYGGRCRNVGDDGKEIPQHHPKTH